MIQEELHTLDPKEVSQLIKDGVELDNSGNHMYIMRFGWNNEFNKAVDPAPFKIESHLNEKLRADALGMPYVIPPYGQTKHVRKREGEKESVTVQEQLESILKIQSDYAIGEIQGSLEYETGNVWLIIDVWPEFQAGIERGYYPPLVSPTFNLIDVNQEGVVNEAQFLNLQAVPTSGYSPEYTQIESVCKNGIKECMAEMKIVGAAGNLEQARKDGVSFSIAKTNESKSMEHSEIEAIVKQVTPAVTEAIKAEVVKPIEELKTKVDEVVKMEETNAEVLKEVATKTEGVDEKKVVTKEGESSDTPPTDPPLNPDTSISGASGKLILKELSEIKSDYKELKNAKDASDKKFKESIVASIVERKTRGKESSAEDKTKLTEKYIAMEIPFLETLDNELKSAIPEASKDGLIAGAYGLYKPESTTNVSDRPKNSEMEVTA